MVKKNINIEGERIYLRPLKEEDASEDYCSWINNMEVNKYIDSKETTIEELKKYINKRWYDPNCLFLGIFLKNKDIHIGNIKLEPIDYEKRKATLGILIGEKEYWNKGYATETLKTLTSYAFNNLRLNEINLGVYKENIGAIKAYEKTGFKIYEENERSYKMRVLKI